MTGAVSKHLSDADFENYYRAALEGGDTLSQLAAEIRMHPRAVRTRRQRMRARGHHLPEFPWRAELATARGSQAPVAQRSAGIATPHPVSAGAAVQGVSTLYGEDGTIRAQWVKEYADKSKVACRMTEMASAFAEAIPRSPSIWPPLLRSEHIDQLCNVYVVTDYHMGMLSWGQETGEDWDLEIAENLLFAWFAKAIQQAPTARRAVLAQLGDFLHWDGMEAVTPASKHVLDADSRFQKVVRVVIRVLRRVIAMLLGKYELVEVIIAEGNHDPAASIWLREFLAAHFEDNPRVEVNTSPDPYYAVEHGKTSIFFHHGHKRGVKNVDDVFVAKFRELFGRTEHSYAHLGHLHHVDVKETNLMVVEQHRTLAAKDAYASRGGWMSGRDAKVITYHKEFGEVGRVVVSPRMAYS